MAWLTSRLLSMRELSMRQLSHATAARRRGAGAADGPGAMQPVDTPQSIAFAESIFLSEMASSFE